MSRGWGRARLGGVAAGTLAAVLLTGGDHAAPVAQRPLDLHAATAAAPAGAAQASSPSAAAALAQASAPQRPSQPGLQRANGRLRTAAAASHASAVHGSGFAAGGDDTFSVIDHGAGHGDLVALRGGWLREFNGANGNLLWATAQPNAMTAMDAGDVDHDGMDDIVVLGLTPPAAPLAPGVPDQVTQTVTMLSGRSGQEIWHRTDVAVFSGLDGAGLLPVPPPVPDDAGSFSESNVDDVGMLDITTSHATVMLLQTDASSSGSFVTTPVSSTTAAYQTTQVRVLLLDGGNGLARGQIVADAVDGYPSVVPVGDVDGDGRTDLLVHTVTYPTEAVTPVDPQGEASDGVAYSGADGHPLWKVLPCSFAQTPPSCPAYGDPVGLDARGRGANDVLFASGNTLTLVAGDTGLFVWQYALPSGTAAQQILLPGSIVTRGSADLIAVSVDICSPCYSVTRLHVLGIAGSNGRTLWEHIFIRGDVRTVSPVSRDLNGDGVGDVVLDTGTSGLMALDGRSGRVLWSRQLAYFPQQLILAGGDPGQGPANVALFSRGNGVMRLEMWSGRDGSTQWIDGRIESYEGHRLFTAPLASGSSANIVVPLLSPDSAICYAPGGRRLWIV